MSRAAIQDDGLLGVPTGPAGAGPMRRSTGGGAFAGPPVKGRLAAVRVTGGLRSAPEDERTGPVEERRAPGEERAAEAEAPATKEGVVERLFEAFSRRELGSVLSLMHPEIVFQPLTAEVSQAGEPYRGHSGIRRYMEDVERYWEQLSVHPTQIRAAGRAVVALGNVSGCGAGGSFANAPTTWVVKFREGMVSQVQIFSDARYVTAALLGEDSDV